MNTKIFRCDEFINRLIFFFFIISTFSLQLLIIVLLLFFSTFSGIQTFIIGFIILFDTENTDCAKKFQTSLKKKKKNVNALQLYYLRRSSIELAVNRKRAVNTKLRVFSKEQRLTINNHRRDDKRDKLVFLEFIRESRAIAFLYIHII